MPAPIIPESPMLQSGYESPDLRRSEATSSRPLPAGPRFLVDPTPATLLPLLEESRGDEGGKGKGNDLRTRLILRHAIRCGIERGDVDLISWLIALEGDWGKILDEEVDDLEDDDGWGVIGMALCSSCGRQEAEEAVRLIVGRWGVCIGPRGGADRTGWTPLHLAALISTPPLISFLLNRGASPHSLTNRGLTALDLVSGMPDRSDIAVFLEHSSTSALVPPVPDRSSLSARRQEMLAKRREKAARRLKELNDDEKQWFVDREKERWVRDLAGVVEVSPELLLEPISKRKQRTDDTSGDQTSDWRDEAEEADEDLEAESDSHQGRNGIEDTDMLVFSLSNLSALLDILISTYRPICNPLESRTLPANALFLHARFAYYRCDETWLEDLVEGAVERIEQGVYTNVEDLAYLAFWAYNSTTLLHLIRTDEQLGMACDDLGLLGMLEELINAIHVFIIRVAEQRIDAILDAALLDHEPLEDFNDVRFEGEWTLFRSFGTGKKQRSLLPKASQIFNQANGSQSNGGEGISSSPSAMLGALRDNVVAASPLKSLTSRASIQDLRSGHGQRGSSVDSLATVVGNGTDSISPRQITDILSGVLMVLQLYEVNPAITIQAFSQIFFWIACEMFNRVLTRKKYLCRSKAVQIRMNITVLEDWVRANGLPIQTATKYLEPINQLLRWLQCLSQVREFDTLIGTMQTLKDINPLQMRKAVRDYRYEVNEGRMTDECTQYLAQLQKDWEKRRIEIGAETVRAQRQGMGDEPPTGVDMEDSTPIDSLFDGTTALTDFVPTSAPESFGELLDSRHMLPFLLPSGIDFLVATPPTDAAFANAPLHTPFPDGTKMSLPGSRASFASSRSMSWAVPDPKKLRRLPRDFFAWMKAKEAERRHGRDPLKPKNGMQPAFDPPLGPNQRLTRPSLEIRGLSAVGEADEDRTPVGNGMGSLGSLVSTPSKLGAGLPSPGLRTSGSLDRMWQQSGLSRSPFETVHPGPQRKDSFELEQRCSRSILLNEDSPAFVTPTRTPRSGVPIPTTSSIFTRSPMSPRGASYDSSNSRNLGPASPTGSYSGSECSPNMAEEGKRKWWKFGRTASSGSMGSVGSDGGR